MRDRCTNSVKSFLSAMLLSFGAVVLSLTAFVSVSHAKPEWGEPPWENYFLDELPFPIQVFEAPVVAGNADNTSQLYWLDENTLVFPGYDIMQKPKNLEELLTEVNGYVYVWRIGSEPEKLYQWFKAPGEIIRGTIVCAADGKIRYSLEPIGIKKDRTEWTYFFGKYGEEIEFTQPYPIPTYQPGKQITWTVRRGVDCEFVNRPDLVDRQFITLRPEHGYLDLGEARPPVEDRGKGDWFLYNDSHPDGWILPWQFRFGAREHPISKIFHTNFHYVSHLRSYVFKGLGGYTEGSSNSGFGNRESCRGMSILVPEVPKISVYCLPRGPWRRFLKDITQSIKGPVWNASHASETPGGLFIEYHQQVYRLVASPEVVRTVRISPSGCRAAFYHSESWKDAYLSHDSFFRSGKGWRVRVMDFCSEGEET